MKKLLIMSIISLNVFASKVEPYIIVGLSTNHLFEESKNVLNDILIEFEIRRENVKTLPSFTRPELTFQVIKDNGTNAKQKDEELTKLLRKLSEEEKVFQLNEKDTKAGLIFTRFVNNGTSGCYGLSNYLRNEFKVDVRWYSGSCPQIQKKSIMTYYNIWWTFSL